MSVEASLYTFWRMDQAVPFDVLTTEETSATFDAIANGEPFVLTLWGPKPVRIECKMFLTSDHAL
jgi:hypothetical protein